MKSLWVLGATFILILLAIINNISVLYSLIGGLIITGIYGLLEGYEITDIYKMALKGVKKSSIVYILFTLIGIIISVWIASGTVPAIMYYGFMIVKPQTFVLSSFILTSVVSMVLGTSFGTVSTVGIALMAIGRGLNINPAIIAGAIISGAYLGDRSSPMSSSAALTSVLTESKLYENLKYMWATLAPALAITILFYYITGISYGGGHSIDISNVKELQEVIRGNFNVSFVVLAPPLIIIILSLFKVNIKLNMLIGIITGVVLAVTLQKVTVREIFYNMVFGYNRQLSSQFLSGIIRGGGAISMVKAQLIIAVSSALNGIFEGTKIMDCILSFFTKNIRKSGGLVLRSAVVSIVTAMYGCSQTLSIIMTGQIMKPVFKRYKISNISLARTIADTSTVLSPLIPWNTAGLVPAVSLGIKVSDFIPYAYLCIILPIITIIYAYLGFIKKEVIDQDSGTIVKRA